MKTAFTTLLVFMFLGIGLQIVIAMNLSGF